MTSKLQNLCQAPKTYPRRALIAPKSLLVGIWIDVKTVFILIIFKICWSTKWNNLSFDQNHLIQIPILFCKYLSPQKLHGNGFVFKICIWISIFRRKKLFENQIFGCWDIMQTKLLILFDTPCTGEHIQLDPLNTNG